MATLLELGMGANALIARIEAADGEITEDVDQQLNEMLAAIDQKVDDYVGLMEEFESRVVSLTADHNRLLELAGKRKDLADAALAVVRRLEDRLQTFMGLRDIKKIKTKLHSITLCDNGGKPGVVYDIGLLPPGFMKTKMTVVADVDAIRRALECGEEVPGCSLKERGQHVLIK